MTKLIVALRKSAKAPKKITMQLNKIIIDRGSA